MAGTDYEIKLSVHLDSEKVPDQMSWEATSHQDGPQEIKAFLLSVFDLETKDTFKIDLWTRDMQVMEMDRFFYQTFRALCDTYKRATHNDKLAAEMEQFTQYFGEQTDIIPSSTV